MNSRISKVFWLCLLAATLANSHALSMTEDATAHHPLSAENKAYSLEFDELTLPLRLHGQGGTQSRVLTYNLAQRRLEFSLGADQTDILATRVFCLDLATESATPARLRLFAQDIDGQVVIDAPLGQAMTYTYADALFQTGLASNARCFTYVDGGDDERFFSLLGADPSAQTRPLFSDRFEQVPGLTISFMTAETDQAAQPLRRVARRSEGQQDRLFPYRVRLSNKGSLDIEGVSVQLLEMFDPAYQARFANQGLVEVSCVPGNTVPGASCGTSADNLTLRRHNIKLPAQSHVDFFLTRQIDHTSDLGQSIVLNAGATTLQTHNNRPIFAAGTHEIILIGDGTWISAEATQQGTVPVGNSLNEIEALHEVRVKAWDTDPDAACGQSVDSCAVPLPGIKIEIDPNSFCLEESSDVCTSIPASEVHFDQDVPTDANGEAVFRIASRRSGNLSVGFRVADYSLRSAGIDSADEVSITLAYAP
ncbi:MAG: hypothetical protein EA370_05595, partial [Wenzhouxiangella sp.]